MTLIATTLVRCIDIQGSHWRYTEERRASSFNKLHLILSDSISAVCALEKGPGRAHKMRRVAQQIGALTLAMFSYRWIPSEWNVSDGPSRGSKFPSKPSRRPRSMIHRWIPMGQAPKKGHSKQVKWKVKPKPSPLIQIPKKMLLVGLHFVISRLLAGGSLVFRIVNLQNAIVFPVC